MGAPRTLSAGLMGGIMRASLARLTVLAALAGLGALGLAGVPAAAPAAVLRPSAAAGAASGLPAGASFVAAPRSAPAAGRARQVCPAATRPGQMTCMSLIPAWARTASAAAGPPHGAYAPADLREAYGLGAASASDGSGVTVAIVDAYNDPDAATDLAAYRSEYGLPACTTADGCLKIVGQSGGSKLPAADHSGEWEFEESLDLDMVSAICPKCSILLVEANSGWIGSLATAETYAAQHANVVSDSWGGAEFTGESAFNSHFDRPGVAIVAAAGDDGYGTQYPAASQFVTSVGGTTLTGATGSNPGTQTAWNGTGSGCSALQPKPAWQTLDDSSPGGCLNRTETDVSAVANPSTPVAIYDSYPSRVSGNGWGAAGGTSVATPIIAASYALAGRPVPGTYPAAYPYLHQADFEPVRSGSNGICEADRRYLCDAADDFAGTSYNGPTGLGTPNGTAGFAAPADAVTVIDPGTRDVAVGSHLRLPVRAVSTSSAELSYTATGLPAGLALGLRSGLITGSPTRAGTFKVTVTVSGASAGKSSASFDVVAVPRLTDPRPVTGPVRLGGRGGCLDADGSRVVLSSCDGGPAQRWEYRLDGSPGGPGRLEIGGKCLAVRSGGAAAIVTACTGSARQQWQYRSGQLDNAGSGRCLDARGGAGTETAAVTGSCSGGAGQDWRLPAAAVLSGIAGKCLSGAHAAKIVIASCGRGSQRWTLEPDGRLRLRGQCLAVAGGSTLDGAATELARCSGKASEKWTEGPGGELLNGKSGRCLADPGNSASGTALVQEDCYGEAGEVWAVS
jgi:Ricin-type beta-trefoil lectin domain/Subtilase family/Putative Ig domain